MIPVHTINRSIIIRCDLLNILIKDVMNQQKSVYNPLEN